MRDLNAQQIFSHAPVAVERGDAANHPAVPLGAERKSSREFLSQEELHRTYGYELSFDYLGEDDTQSRYSRGHDRLDSDELINQQGPNDFSFNENQDEKYSSDRSVARSTLEFKRPDVAMSIIVEDEMTSSRKPPTQCDKPQTRVSGLQPVCTEDTNNAAPSKDAEAVYIGVSIDVKNGNFQNEATPVQPIQRDSAVRHDVGATDATTDDSGTTLFRHPSTHSL